MANTEFSFFVEDRTDGTRWTMTETGYTEQEARDKVLNRIAPHVRILRSGPTPDPERGEMKQFDNLTSPPKYKYAQDAKAEFYYSLMFPDPDNEACQHIPSAKRRTGSGSFSFSTG